MSLSLVLPCGHHYFPHTKWLTKITDYRDTAALKKKNFKIGADGDHIRHQSKSIDQGYKGEAACHEDWGLSVVLASLVGLSSSPPSSAMMSSIMVEPCY